MRTTVEIPDAQRAHLLRLAAERGEKGFSGIVQEALRQFLDAEKTRAARVKAAKGVLGSLDDQAADALEASVKALRKTWR